jgi:hypothetical protein
MRGYCSFLGGQGNGLTYHSYIIENHPVLDSFSFQTGFYLIENDKPVEKLVGSYNGGFGCSGGETNPSNFYKYFELGDNLTITPYQIRDKVNPNPLNQPEKENYLLDQPKGGKALIFPKFSASPQINRGYLKELFRQNNSLQSLSLNKQKSKIECRDTQTN